MKETAPYLQVLSGNYDGNSALFASVVPMTEEPPYLHFLSGSYEGNSALFAGVVR